ncbi:MAG: class I SAM-dependent methyltransferase [Alphaproteobacteria bacterium]
MTKVNYDGLARQYAQHRSTLPEITEALLQGGSLTRDSRVLEVGCGTGNYIRAIESAVGCACWGLDRSGEMLGHARAHSSGVEYSIGDATRLDFADESFDFVYSVDVIHHLGAKDQYYKEAYRVLGPGGRLCTMTHSEELIRRSMVMSRFFPEAIETNLARYPRIAELWTWMRDAGFGDLAEDTITSPFEIADSDCYSAKAYSTLHTIPQDAFERGLARLERELTAGPVTGVQRQSALWGSKPVREVSP